MKIKLPTINEWLKALESGGRRQTKSRLAEIKLDYKNNRRSSYCCLGVYCELAAKQGAAVKKTNKRYRINAFDVQYDFCDGEGACLSLLSDSVKEAMGMAPNKGKAFSEKRLVELNDEHGKSFRQIAQYIRENTTPAQRRKRPKIEVDEADAVYN